MIYLTYNDQPSGVFSSQVNDVCNFLNTHHNAGITLVAFISLRGFFKNRKMLKTEVIDAVVFPALPTARYWQFSSILFSIYCLLRGEKIVISRNVIATMMALSARKKGIIKSVTMDGRGAIAAEWQEYEVVAYPELKKHIARWEKKSVLESNFRIAVSQKLVDWWRSEYDYKGDDHVVIPCTLHTSFSLLVPEAESTRNIRQREGFKEEDIIMVYSGSTSGWQSFSRLGAILGNFLSADHRYKILFLSKSDDAVEKMKLDFPGQVFSRWLTFDKVQAILGICDYGILYREDSITNQVAAPTKFAEYLSAGLPVMISPCIGDYSAFVEAHKCGIIVTGNDDVLPEKTTHLKKSEMVALAAEYFTKKANDGQYRHLLKSLNKKNSIN